MTAFTIRRPSRRPLVVVIGVLAIAIGTQVASVWNGDQAGLDEPLLAAPPAAEIDTDAGTIGRGRCERRRGPCPDQRGPPRGRECRGRAAVDPAPAVPTHVDPAPAAPANAAPKGFDPTAELTRIRADVDFWAGAPDGPPQRHRGRREARRVRRRRGPPDRRRDRLPARRAGRRCGARRAARLPPRPVDAREHPRRRSTGSREARDLARSILFRSPADATALGVLGDASLELGDLDAPRRVPPTRGWRSSPTAPRPASAPRGSPSSRRPGGRGGRRPHRGGVARPRRGRSRATRSASTTSRWARRSSPTGDAAGARAAFEAALAVRPDLPAALVGLAKLDAFDGDLSTPRSPSSTRPSPRSRCPTRSRAGPTC